MFLKSFFLCKFEGESLDETTVSPVEEDTTPSDLEAIMVDDFDNKWLR